MNVRVLVLLLLVMISITSCDQLKAREEADAGVAALKSCDFENAYIHFRNADIYLPGHHKILVGLAISEWTYYLDHPQVRVLFDRLGFGTSLHALCIDIKGNDEPEDAHAPSGCGQIDFSHLSRGVSQHLTQTGANHYYERIDPELTWDNIFVTLRTNRHLLTGAAEHALAAANANQPYFRAGLFLEYDISLHSLELALLSMAANLLSVVLDAVAPYSWDFSVRETVKAFETGEYTQLVQSVNQNLLHLRKPYVHADAENRLARVFSALRFAIPHFKTLKEAKPVSDKNGCVVLHSLLNWKALPYGILSDLEKASNAVDDSGITMVLDEFLDPSVRIDLNSIASHPPNLKHPIAHLKERQWTWHLEELQEQLNRSFEPPLFNAYSPSLELREEFSIRINTAWLHWNPRSLFELW